MAKKKNPLKKVRKKLSKIKIVGLSITAVLSLIIIGVLSWAFFALIYEGSSDLLKKIGVTSIYAQYILVIIIGVLALILLGYSGNKILKETLNS